MILKQVQNIEWKNGGRVIDSHSFLGFFLQSAVLLRESTNIKLLFATVSFGIPFKKIEAVNCCCKTEKLYCRI